MNKYFILILKMVIAVVLLQTLFYKFSGAQESVDLFTKLVHEKEAYMRIGTGIIELIASVLLFVPNKNWLGSSLAASTMSVAISSHLTILGIVNNNDGGVLFYSALITLIAALIVLFHHRKEIPIVGKIFSEFNTE